MILYAVVVVYLFVCTLSGIRKLGVRILWIELFPVRSKATSPQGLLLMAAYLIMSFIALTFEMTTIAPRYAVFGSQRYVAADGVEKYCSFDAPVSECHMTQISKFVGSVIGVNQSFVGVIIYYASYVFIVVSVVDAVLSFIRKKSDRIEIGSDSFDEDDDIEIDYRKPSRDYDSDPLDEPDGVILQK